MIKHNDIIKIHLRGSLKISLAGHRHKHYNVYVCIYFENYI